METFTYTFDSIEVQKSGMSQDDFTTLMIARKANKLGHEGYNIKHFHLTNTLPDDLFSFASHSFPYQTAFTITFEAEKF